MKDKMVDEGIVKAIADAIASQLGHNTLGKPIPIIWKQGKDAFVKEIENTRKKKQVKEDVPTNSMGTSSSTSGPIQTYDPMLGTKKRIRDMWRRILRKR